MVSLPEMPACIAKLPRDERGFPVPWFVQWLDRDGQPTTPGTGTPDFRVMDSKKFVLALRQPRCWVCGDLMGQHRVFVIGPMCAITRTTSEPANHRKCAEFAAKACPFLTKPRMRRNEKDKPDGHAAGLAIDRNPGVACLYEAKDFKTFRPHAGGAGILIRLGDPLRVDWWANGRTATRDEIMQSINSGFPLLENMARQDGPDAMADLIAQRDDALRLVPA